MYGRELIERAGGKLYDDTWLKDQATNDWDDKAGGILHIRKY